MIKEELTFCLGLWKKQGFCTFGGKTHCEQCATPYLLYKMMTGKVLHGEKTKRLSLEEWESIILSLEK
jgi:hypothetical protein